MVDDIFQGGTILLPDEEIPRGKRAIHRKLNEFLRVVMNHPDLTSTILPYGKMVDVKSGWFITTRRNSFNLRWIARLPRGISSSGSKIVPPWKISSTIRRTIGLYAYPAKKITG